MQKIIKRTALLLALALAVVCLGIFASACGEAKEYTITVHYADGTVVDGTKDKFEVQICDANGGACYENTFIDANGVAKFDKAALDTKAENAGNQTKYILHVYDGRTELELKEKYTVDNKNATVTITLKDRNAQ